MSYLLWSSETLTTMSYWDLSTSWLKFRLIKLLLQAIIYRNPRLNPVNNQSQDLNEDYNTLVTLMQRRTVILSSDLWHCMQMVSILEPMQKQSTSPYLRRKLKKFKISGFTNASELKFSIRIKLLIHWRIGFSDAVVYALFFPIYFTTPINE